MVLPDLALSERAARDLGFSEVQAILDSLCATPFGREELARSVFPTDEEALAVRLEESLEARAAVERNVAPDFAALRDVRHVLDAANKGVVLGSMDILDVAKTLEGLARLHDVIAFQGQAAPRLSEIARQIDDDRRFSQRVFRSFDEQGQLTDDASPDLAMLRAKVRALRAEAQELLSSLIRSYDESGLLRDRNFTVRNDRYVLPVKSEFQGRIDGIVHDASQTHQTVYMEPRALLQIGNRIKIARAEVEQEEQRILRELSLEIAELSGRLRADLARAGRVEAAFARGMFAARTDGNRVKCGSEESLSLKCARHPLLEWLRFVAQQEGRDGAAVVGNDIAFGNARALVISGPNAGGKTVALKTAGLVTLLARAGIPAATDPGSTVPAYAAVCCAIGDAQSLEGALSSFSGHLVVLRGILDEIEAHVARGPVLVLLDELLAGTDPAQGAALAQALLEHIVDRGACVIATTHYERLKAKGVEDTRFRNASVSLDDKGRPTFRLKLDHAGTSNAFEAARRYGLPDDVVARAEQLMAPEERELQSVLRTLSEQKDLLQRQLEGAEAERARLQDEAKKLEQRLADVERESTRLRREGKRAFLDELKEARRAVAAAIEETKGRDARVLNRISHELQDLEAKTKADAGALPVTTSLLKPAQIHVGDQVELASMPGTRLTVLEVDGEEAVLTRGVVKLRTPIDNLRVSKEKPRGRRTKGT